MFEQITANRWRSFLLIASFALLVGGLGWIFGLVIGGGWTGLVVAGVIAIVLSWTSYFYSDRIVLAVSRAKPADPIAHGRLINVVEGLSIAAGLPPPRVYVVDDRAPNAFATGRNPQHAAVAVTTGLLEKMSRVELEGVLAHELSHIRNYDILVTTIAVVLAGVVALLADWTLRGFRYGSFRGRGRGKGAAAIPLAAIGLILALLSPLIAQLIQAAVSRRRESLADLSAVTLTRYPPGLISALKKLRDDSTVVRTSTRATAHLWIESPLERQAPGFSTRINRLFDTHPPIEERIRILEGL
jgi:heat shock protein HtpX